MSNGLLESNIISIVDDPLDNRRLPTILAVNLVGQLCKEFALSCNLNASDEALLADL